MRTSAGKLAQHRPGSLSPASSRPRRGRGAVAASLLVLLLVGAWGCGGGKVREDPILRLSAQEALEEGKRLMEEGKYMRAGDFLTHAFEVEPNSADGREALLLAADALYLARGTDNLIRAEAKYRDFQNRFPTSDRAAYTQFQIASTLAARVRKPDRDQTATRKALEAFRDVLRLYPDSGYAEQAREQIVIVNSHLAEHEFLVGKFNLRIGVAQAAVNRFQVVFDEYPNYTEMDKLLFFMGRAHCALDKKEEAVGYLSRLRAEYPDSPFLKEIPAEGCKK